MSFFRNIRSSISRGKSSSRDTTPVRNSRPSSVIGGAGNYRRDSLDSHTDSQILNRSDTFILGDELTDKSATNSNCSTLEKKSKKSKVFGKFSTFTKRKKTPSSSSEQRTNNDLEHHPSDNATNTYYNWQCEGGLGIDYDAQTDPFNFLYEQQSTLKALQQASANNSRTNSLSSSSPTPKEVVRPKFDSSTFRKNSTNLANYPLKEQLEQLKSLNNKNFLEDEDHHHQHHHHEGVPNQQDEDDAEKYRTITLSSFRKSFQDRFLQQQQDDDLEEEVFQKPAWFVKVDHPKSLKMKEKAARDLSQEAKENRSDYLIFANENYRPGSRSPVRNDRPSRSKTRSPVKRNETFKVESPSYYYNGEAGGNEEKPSIQIAFRNSIASTTPIARIVPVGVAKPMPSSNDYYHHHNHHHHHQRQKEASLKPNQNSKKSSSSLYLAGAKTNRSPIRNLFGRSSASSPSPSPLRHKISSNPSQNQNNGRFQTLVQIKNNDPRQNYNQSPHYFGNHTNFSNNSNNSRNLQNRSTTKINLSSNPSSQQMKETKPSLNSDYQNSLARLSYANIPPPNKTYDINGRLVVSGSGSALARNQKNLFGGGTHMASTISSANKRQPIPFGAGYIVPPVPQTKPQYQSQGRSNNSNLYLGQNQSQSQNQSQNQNHHLHHQHQHQHQQNFYNLNQKQNPALHQLQHQHQHQSQIQSQQPSSPASHKSRIMVSMQRRSRSPIKMPWR